MKPGYRAIGAHKLNPIGLGAMNLSHAYGVPPEEGEAIRLLNEALDQGYTHLDTAQLYGAGANEALVGKAVSHRRDEFFLASKVGIIIEDGKRRIDGRPETVKKAVDVSLQRLKTDHINLYYLHRRDFTVPIEETVGAFKDAIDAGKIGGYGLSEVSVDTLTRAWNEHPMLALQNEYSPWTRNVELGVLAACEKLGVALVSYSPLARGVLANGVDDPKGFAPKDIRTNMPRFNAENWPVNHKLALAFNQIAAEHDVTPAQLCLAWLLSRSPVVHAIPGTSNRDHMKENIARWDWTIPAEAASRIDALINHDTVAGHRYPEPVRPTIDTEDFD
ncbi:aldo/keto reductase [Kordiimonas marina]|uniref:aldo/keto reductase n=1 Tax=Kordiimonas marina TaxID=2872312 RepID=UPI001FF6488B|nr:aldo/keto reductase [Kordiimonas marina]MCJ9427764.1 aldo/keto reductase [Kordiimonas marina]